MYYIYILFSESANRYYIGYSSDPYRRLKEHNYSRLDSYTARNRPWALKAVFKCGKKKKDALIIERFIKKQKSKTLLERLCDPSFVPTEKLAQLVRVPHMRN